MRIGVMKKIITKVEVEAVRSRGAFSSAVKQYREVLWSGEKRECWHE